MGQHLSDACLTASSGRTAAFSTRFQVYPRALGHPVAMDPVPRRMLDEPGPSRRVEVIVKVATLPPPRYRHLSSRPVERNVNHHQPPPELRRLAHRVVAVAAVAMAARAAGTLAHPASLPMTFTNTMPLIFQIQCLIPTAPVAIRPLALATMLPCPAPNARFPAMGRRVIPNQVPPRDTRRHHHQVAEKGLALEVILQAQRVKPLVLDSLQISLRRVASRTTSNPWLWRNKTSPELILVSIQPQLFLFLLSLDSVSALRCLWPPRRLAQPSLTRPPVPLEVAARPTAAAAVGPVGMRPIMKMILPELPTNCPRSALVPTVEVLLAAPVAAASRAALQ